ncbi:RDD family protein, partial [Bradyrhizobium sp. 25ACV]
PLPYSGFWARFAAYLIDGLILGVPFAITFAVLIFMFGGLGVMLHRTPPADPRDVMAVLGPLFAVFWLVLFINMAIQWLYFA